MNSVTEMLLIIINNSYQKDTNYYIALKLLQMHLQIATLSVSALAKVSNTSVASINKFCKILGLSSFSELKFALQNGINARKEQMLFRLSKMDEEEILSSITHYAQPDFDIKSFKASVYQLVDMIETASDIELIGAYFPTSLSINFQEDMITMGKFVYINPQKRYTVAEPLSQQTLILFVTLTGRLYEFSKSDFDSICKKYQNISLISGYVDYPNYSSIKSLIRIPIFEDTEIGNILILEIFRYIKYLYYHKYGKDLI